MKEWLRPETSLPADYQNAVLVGRAWVPAVGPTLVRIQDAEVQDLSPVAATTSQLLDLDDPAAAVRSARGLRRVAGLDDVLANSMSPTAATKPRRGSSRPATCRRSRRAA